MRICIIKEKLEKKEMMDIYEKVLKDKTKNNAYLPRDLWNINFEEEGNMKKIRGFNAEIFFYQHFKENNSLFECIGENMNCIPISDLSYDKLNRNGHDILFLNLNNGELIICESKSKKETKNIVSDLKELIWRANSSNTDNKRVSVRGQEINRMSNADVRNFKYADLNDIAITEEVQKNFTKVCNDIIYNMWERKGLNIEFDKIDNCFLFGCLFIEFDGKISDEEIEELNEYIENSQIIEKKFHSFIATSVINDSELLEILENYFTKLWTRTT
ncbi:hypothetical protein [Spiroplasma monobiae]|uniref:Uncharacterized protein n=1 Tax=Spiroplasma monobiae MQ-1 TaxID=1336748 RepID=A0A2K9LUQ8_SPISQ|nr:hypothetical protein [Spiroplasma monobiae]AUM62760.1 hypothetical protein SMONO_v1c05110 [Spiroplasma monobiae MQ-1]